MNKFEDENIVRHKRTTLNQNTTLAPAWVNGLCDVEIRAPHAPYADRAQEIHIKVIHSLIDYIERNV